MDSPVKNVAKVVFDRLQAVDSALDGLQDWHISLLKSVLNKDYKIETYRLTVDTNEKRIIISVFDKSGHKVFFRPKNVNIFNNLLKYANLSNWRIVFENKKGQYN